MGYGWASWLPAYYLFVSLVGWLSNTLKATEWTVAGRELGCRSWHSWPGRKPSKVMDLGPDVEAVHETTYRWRVWPNAIFVAPWQARRLVEAMERADVRVIDWRGDWARRHRLLNGFGVFAYYGGAVGVFVAIALLPLPRPGSGAGTGAFLAPVGAVVLCLAAFALGWAIDYLPWSMRKPSAQESGWRQPPPGPSAGAWDLQTQVGPAPGLEFGGFWLRVVAYLIDMSLLGIVGIVLSSALGAAGQAMGALIFIAYSVGLWGTTGQTVGMMLLGLHVVRDVDGGKISWGNAGLRFVGLFVAFACVYIGVIWVAFDSRKRGWHDKIGGTVVVRNVGLGSAGESTRRLNLRQGAMAGIIVSFVVAASAAGSSKANLQTFVLVLAVPLTVTVVITAVALAINRRAGRPRDL
jgi:uncharacterized RDD family membrane protein YckC